MQADLTATHVITTAISTPMPIWLITVVVWTVAIAVMFCSALLLGPGLLCELRAFGRELFPPATTDDYEATERARLNRVVNLGDYRGGVR